MSKEQLQLIKDLIREMIYLDRLEHDVDAKGYDKMNAESRIEQIEEELKYTPL